MRRALWMLLLTVLAAAPAAAQLDESCVVSILNRTAQVKADGSWRRSNPFFVDVEVRLDTIVSQATIGYATRRWLRTEGFYAYSRQDSVIPGEPIQRHRIGMQVVVSQPMRIR